MCSINSFDNEDGTADLTFETPVLLSEETNCRRCNQQAWVVLKRKDAYCQKCFDQRVTHKVHATLGKSKLMRPSDRVLVAFSGSGGSAALLHMLWAGANQQGHKKLLYDIFFCFIDDGVILKHDVNQRLSIIAANKKTVESYGFEFHWSSLANSLTGCDALNDDVTDSTDDKRLLDLFNDVKSVTAREDLHLRLTHNLLVGIAKKLKCNKIFTAETQTRLAVKLLTSVALGRGEQLSLEVGFTDTRYDVSIMRPLSDLEDKEVAYYNQLHGLGRAEGRVGLSTGLPTAASISKLTSTFLLGLQHEFPSTVSTVFRTGEKLSAACDVAGGSNEVTTCLLCQGRNFISDKKYAVEAAIALSHHVSMPRVVEGCSTKSTFCGKCDSQVNECCGGGCSTSKTPEFTEQQLRSCFCYGCLLIVREMSSVDKLPRDVTATMFHRIKMNSMREQIADFLL